MQSVSFLQFHNFIGVTLIPFEDSTFIFSSDLISTVQGKQCRRWATSLLVNVKCFATTMGYNLRMIWCEVSRTPLSSLWSVLWETVNQSVPIRICLVELFIKWVFYFILVVLLLSQPLSFKELTRDFIKNWVRSLPYQSGPFEKSTKTFLIVWHVFCIPNLVVENKANGIKSIRQIDKNSLGTLSTEL